MRLWLVAYWMVALGCVSSNSEPCSDGRVCPARTVCDNTHDLCVGQDQFSACDGMADGTACQFADGRESGTCNQMVCLTPVCGDSLIELPERCDDGNQTDEDPSVQTRCSSNCGSLEVCGNGIIDVVMGERCDDGNLLDHDGCSSACQPETLQWNRLADPSPQFNPIAAYDASRGRVVLYSTPANAQSSVVAEWDGVWHASIPAVAPGPPRRFAAMAAFGSRRSIILHGGGLKDGPDNQTWEWDGVKWTRLADGPTLQEHAMAYDAHRQRVVIFGGDDGGKAVADTWELDGNQWVQITTATSPPARYDHSMAYDPVRGVVVMFGGRDASGNKMTDTWEYDGQTWTLKNTGMPVLQRTPLAYSRKAHGVVMVGGFNSSGVGTNTMYVWSGSAWTSTATPITARGWHALSETSDGGLLVFGGSSDSAAGTLRPDTWLYDGSTWAAALAPLPRIGLEAVNTRHGVIAFGGEDESSAYPGSTWQLGMHAAWTSTASSPTGRILSPLAYDEARDVVVELGGDVNGSTADDFTWQRSGSVWSSIHPFSSPQPRGAHTLTYDVARAQVVLFGGVVGSTPVNDTWTFDGTSWMQRNPTMVPPARAYASMLYDRINDVVLLFGGVDTAGMPLTDLWSWNGTDWSPITPLGDQPHGSDYPRNLVWMPSLHSAMLIGGDASPTMESWQLLIAPGSYTWIDQRTLTAPPTRIFPAAFLAPDQSGVIVYGGTDGSNAQSDGWLLSYVGTGASDTCITATDLDGDGLGACADPDCWPVCQPLCPPATSCPSGTPSCGDGSCDSGLETCHNCPADCMGCAPICGDGVCDAGETCVGDCP